MRAKLITLSEWKYVVTKTDFSQEERRKKKLHCKHTPIHERHVLFLCLFGIHRQRLESFFKKCAIVVLLTANNVTIVSASALKCVASPSVSERGHGIVSMGR